MRLDATQANVSVVRDGEVLGNWPLDLSNYPQELPLPVEKAGTTEYCFVTGENRACADFLPGQRRPLTINFQGGVIATVIEARRSTPPAVFDAAYQEAHRGRTVVEVPEVHELVNIAIAVSPYGGDDHDMVYHESAYFRAVQEHFGAHRDHPLIQRIDAMLRADRSDYFQFKMNGYAFIFDDQGRIVRSPVYDRTGFEGSLDNALLPYLEDLNDFARVSGFRDFYAANRDLYERQIRFFETEAQVSRISDWLVERFPTVRAYDGVKIIFSPLVAYNQSLTVIEADGYRELQPHVNYPYAANRGLSAEGAAIERSAILFTEMNHGFVNPTTRQHRERVMAAMADRALWADDASQAARSYAGGEAVFNEYMNWGLVSLYYRDRMSPEDFAISNPIMVANMQEGRGFRRFADFNAALLALYDQRRPGQTLEDLYPQIVAWFEEQASAHVTPPSR